MNGTKPILGDRENLLKYLEEALSKASKVKIIVSFLMESGVKLLLEVFDDLVRRGVPIQIITSRYLNLTQPSALYLLKERYGERIELQFFIDLHKSFHPKTYIIHFTDGNGCVFVGSSNVSQSALTTGVEWNYRLDKLTHGEDFIEFDQAFDEYFLNYSTPITDEMLREYAKNWKRPKIDFNREEVNSLQDLGRPTPIPAQREALYELKKTREEGYTKALVIAATGIGKTYLSAFDAMNFKRVLFVAHREEILKQAKNTFSNVMPERSTAFFGGGVKETHADIIFAMVQTLGKREYLDEKYFSSKDFNYVVIDEFHHAAAESYRRILSYFQPDFLLGLTATPFRMDNREIFSLCDNNIAYEVNLKDAINRGWLVPFRYYGIHDDIDYSKIPICNGQYNVKQLEEVLATGERADLVLKHYLKYRRGKGLGFCATIQHAEYMTEYFRLHEIKSVVVHSDANSTCSYWMERDTAIKEMKAGKIDIIFSVDMFNEGVDIPIVDLVLFLRPTESYTVFLQQLGRGLRKNPGKEYLTILDFIGNYKNVQAKINFFAGEVETSDALEKLFYDPKGYEELLPDGCLVDFDFQLINLFKSLASAVSVDARLEVGYKEVKNMLDRRPTRYDMFKYRIEDVDLYLKKYKGWLRFLERMGELTDEEKGWLGTEVETFFLSLEKTAMSKSYKIPVLLSLVDDEGLKAEVSLREIGEHFQNFFVNDKVHQKDLKDKRHKNFDKWDLDKYMCEARINPVKFLGKDQFFWYNEDRQVFGFNPDLLKWFSAGFREHYLDIVTWREKNYFTRRY